MSNTIRNDECEYCTRDKQKRKLFGFDSANDGIAIGYGAGMAVIEADSFEIEIKYCPMCGRELSIHTTQPNRSMCAQQGENNG